MARRLIRTHAPLAEVAAATGSYDQSHPIATMLAIVNAAAQAYRGA